MPTQWKQVKDLRDALRDAHERVRIATKSSARMQKRYHDERSKQTSFCKGQKVLVVLAETTRPTKIQEAPKALDRTMGDREFQNSSCGCH